ncbi:MAG: hypothetical protein HY799_02125 [Nitrosomonadales bacterium]|nr:hypothetical protein [Nitrosomonadales bacterium]
MANVAGSKDISKSSGAKKRPDGVDTNRYKNLEKWSYRKWAWEFLRRNPEYIAECKRLRSGTDAEKLAVAQQFGLKKFKEYSEGYKGPSGMPRFSMGSISSWTNLDCDNTDGRRVAIRLGYAQVLVRFNLAPVIQEKKALDKQFRMAEQRIKKRLAVYEKIITKEAASHKYKAVSFGIYIRLLDLLNAGASPLECAQQVFPGKVNNAQTENYLRQAVKNPINSAKKMAEEGYLHLSVLKGKPNGKRIPLAQ